MRTRTEIELQAIRRLLMTMAQMQVKATTDWKRWEGIIEMIGAEAERQLGEIVETERKVGSEPGQIIDIDRCRYAMIWSGAQAVPRSCPTCGLGPCQFGLKDPLKAAREAPAAPAVPAFGFDAEGTPAEVPIGGPWGTIRIPALIRLIEQYDGMGARGQKISHIEIVSGRSGGYLRFRYERS